MKKRYTVLGAALVIVLLLALSTSLVRANPPYIIVHKVDPEGNPIEGWLIKIYKLTAEGEWVFMKEGTTDEFGTVTLTDLTLAPWRVWEEARECWEPIAPVGLTSSMGGYYIDVDPGSGYPGDVSFVNDYTCDESPGTGTPGYWKNHPEAWPVEEITIGGVTYTKEDAIGFMMTPERGDKTLTMFRALVAARLNVLIGNDDSCIAATIEAADNYWMAMYGPVGSGVSGDSEAWMTGEPLYLELDDYNNGLLCAPARD
jgi:hypothetical protein